MEARRTLIGLTLATLSLAAAPPASQPAAAGTDDVVSLGNDLVRLHAPPAQGWTVPATGAASTDRVYFEKADHKSAIEFQLTTPDYPLTSDNGGAMATGIIKALKQKRQQEGREVVLPPTAEKDRRFQVVVHEKYKVGTVTVDTLHLLRLVGPRTVMVVASTGADDPAVATDTFTAAKDALASAKYNKPAAGRRRP